MAGSWGLVMEKERSGQDSPARQRRRTQDVDELERKKERKPRQAKQYVTLGEVLSEAVLWDEEVGVYPWGFKDRVQERRFREHFAHTFARR